MKMAVESMEMASVGNSQSRQGAGTEISVPRTRVDDDGSYGTFRGWRLLVLRVFPRIALNRRKGDVGGRPGAPHHP